MDPVSCLIAQIRHADRRFKKVSRQVTILNNKIASTRDHYDRACRDGRKTFACKRSLQLTTYQGVRQMYFEYAAQRCEEIQQLCDTLWEVAGLEYDDVVQDDSQEVKL
jgi:hypothetical protein